MVRMELRRESEEWGWSESFEFESGWCAQNVQAEGENEPTTVGGQQSRLQQRMFLATAFRQRDTRKMASRCQHEKIWQIVMMHILGSGVSVL